MRPVRRLLICAVLIASLIGLAPWGLYGIGLSNIEGPPTPLTAPSPNPAGEDVLRHGDSPQSAVHAKRSPLGIRAQAMTARTGREADEPGCCAALDYT
jgi:hypothetical protein